MISKPRALVLFIVLLTLAAGCDSTAPAEGTGTATALPPATALPASPTAVSGATATASATPTSAPEPTAGTATFDGERAFAQLEAQMAFGPRYPGSAGHEAVGNYIVEELQALGWDVSEQIFPYQGLEGRNIIARANEGQGQPIIVGAHYDTRRMADQTPGAVEDELPVPGAVDGASGVAVLLELARTLDLDEVPAEIWLAFFDLEDNGGGGIEGWDWIVGSTYMAQNLETMPQAMVLVDMIGDAEQQLYYEGNSDPQLRQELWQIAADLGYDDVFIPEVRHTMIDDHVPFKEQGIPAVDIIDFDYPYWHTVEDTADKASAQSLLRVGRTLEVWLEDRLE